MKSSPSYHELVTELAGLHQHALECGDKSFTRSDSSSTEVRSQAIYSEASTRLSTRQRGTHSYDMRLHVTAPRVLAFTALAAALCTSTALYWRHLDRRVTLAPDLNPTTHDSSHVDATYPSEMPVALHPRVVTASMPSGIIASSTLPVPDPCLHRGHADGNRPLIDDFERGSPLIVPREGRVGFWGFYLDNVPPSSNLPIVPELRSRPLRNNRYAMHTVGGELRNWGAVLELKFQPGCYDASAYRGLSFSALGPGRLYVGIREPRVVPVQWGGTCTSDCYDAHQMKVELTHRWQRFSVTWADLHQRSYDAPALDPTRINSIAFQIQPGDTPFNVWVDDLEFIPG
jgi:hypothetical protein